MSVIVHSPLRGTAIKMSEVSDPVFGQKMLGDGVAIKPEFKTGLFAKNEVLCSPVDGEVVLVFKEKHAIGFTTADGKEILIHMGIDTVELKGEPFNIKCKVGDKVTAGQQIGTVNFKAIVKAGKDTVTPVIWTNGAGVDVKPIKDNGPVEAGTPIFEIL